MSDESWLEEYVLNNVINKYENSVYEFWRQLSKPWGGGA